MTAQIILEFRAKSNCIEASRDFLRRVLPDTRGYTGCISIVVVQNQDDPASFMIVEQWDSRAHYEKYLAWRTESGVMNEFAAMMQGEPSIRFFDYCGV